MKSTKFLLASAVCAAMLFAGCSEKGGEDQQKTYTITVTGGGNGTAVADKTTAAEGATVKLTATADDGYEFVKWTVESGGITLPATATATFTMPARDVSVKAEFAASEYAVTVTSGSNGTAVADKATAAEGATVTLTATANSDYVFWRWVVTSGEVVVSNIWLSSATFIMPAGDIEIKAEFSSVISPALINGITWAAYNVDAPGTFAANPEDTGMFYQWNHKTGWSSDDPLTSSPAGATWDNAYIAGESWAAENDPCPEGWRVPTIEEFEALCDDEETTNEWIALNGFNGRRFTDKVSGNSVFFLAAGRRLYTGGALADAGFAGYCWSATAGTSPIAYTLHFGSIGVTTSDTSNRGLGYPVRCVAK